MAEALVTVVIEKSMSVVYQYTKDAVTLVLKAKDNVEKFRRHLEAIQGALEDAERKQLEEARVRHWLDQLKDVSYEMDDVLDEWNTEILKQGQYAVVTQRNVCFSIPSGYFCFGKVRKAISYHQIASKIKDLNEKLSLIAAEKEDHSFLQSSVRQVDEQLNHDDKRKTSSFVDKSMIFGRLDEKANLLSKLSGESSQGGENVLIIPIVGLGGTGKTTLAKVAYNSDKANFDTKIWVCVSDPFSVIEIAKNIIRRTGNNIPDSNVPEDVLQCLSESIEGKKCLIVLDDVWTEEREMWENLNLPTIMQKCAHGSRILVTTRKEGVAQMMRATTHIIRLGGLSDQDSLSLFKSIAFLDREEDYELNGFKIIGESIARKCNGLPLALKSLASLVQYKKKRNEWRDVLESRIWDLEGFAEEVFQPLLLSYYDLTPVVKRCLLYCVTFPKDYRFDKDNLIELWMSQDYLSVKEHIAKTALGEKIFNNLVMRSFFQDVVEDKIIVSCKIHDIVHALLQFLCKNECFVMEAQGGSTRVEVESEIVRHLTLLFAPDNPLSSFISSMNCNKLRTLATFDSSITCIKSKDISQLKCVRTLILSYNDIKKLPKEMGKLVHLRYVDLSENKSLEKLPDSLCNLYNLQTLRLVNCKELKKLPEDMGSLISLTQLHIEGSGVKSPKAIGRLANLQTLDVCPVYASDLDEVFGSLDRLQGSLTINILEDLENSSEAEEEKECMCNKEKLLHLTVNFEGADEDDSGQRRRSSNAEIVLRRLRPHENLETLSISGWKGITWPGWFWRLENLRLLTLRSCGECEYLPALGKVPFLEEITIEEMPKVKTVGDEFLGIAKTSSQPSSSTSSSSSCVLFPKLKKLRFVQMDKWEHWGGLEKNSSEITVMPRLSFLEIHQCMELRNLPEEMGELVHLRYVDLSENESLEKLPDSLCNLYNLQTLRLVNCKELKKLPEDMGSLISLTQLHIEGSGVKSPKAIGRLANLQTLDVCPVYASDLDEVFGSLDRLQGSLTINILEDLEKSNEAEEEKECICNKEKLIHLTVNFEGADEDDSDQRRRSSNAEIVLRRLRPHENLETLSISGWKGITWPGWFWRLENLRLLTLRSCGECEYLPALGKVPFLEEITIKKMPKVKTVGDEFLGIAETSSQPSSSTSSLSSCVLFPKLKTLRVGDMDKWEQWGGLEENSSEITVMPRLSLLDIYYCMELQNLPAFLRNGSALSIQLYNCDKMRCDDFPGNITRAGDEYIESDDGETYFFFNSQRILGNMSSSGVAMAFR